MCSNEVRDILNARENSVSFRHLVRAASRRILRHRFGFLREEVHLFSYLAKQEST
jgi:hypothetical protein